MYPALAPNGLGDERGDIAAGLVIDRPFDHVRAPGSNDLGIVRAERVSVGVGHRRPGDARHVWPAVRFARLVAGDRERRVGAAVERLGQRDELAPPGRGLGQAHGCLDALGAGICEEGLLQSTRADICQFLGGFGHDRHVVDVRGSVDDLLELLLDRGDHPGMAMPGVIDRDPGEAIQVLGAVDVPDCRAFRPVYHDRFEGGHETGRHELLVTRDGLVMRGLGGGGGSHGCSARMVANLPVMIAEQANSR